MNFRQQLSEAYKAGYNQGLVELQEKQSPAGGGSVPTSTKSKNRPRRGPDPLADPATLSAGYHEGMRRGLMAGYHEAMKEMDHEEDEGYHEGAHEMDEKALAELGRMMIRAGMHEMDHEEDEGYHEGMHEGEHEEMFHPSKPRGKQPGGLPGPKILQKNPFGGPPIRITPTFF